MQIGQQQSRTSNVLRQLQNRFGVLDETVQAHVRVLPLEEIEALSDALFGLATQDNLGEWLQQHPLSASSPATT